MFGNHVAAARTSTAKDTAPVRVFTEHSALGEVRRTDEAGHAESFFVAFSLFNAEFDELRCTFTVADNVLGEALHHERQSSAEFALFAEGEVFVLDAAHAVSKHDASVVRAGVTINRNGVEGVCNVGAEFSKEVYRQSKVSRDKRKHRCHVRVDHARTLAGATDSHHTLFSLDFHGVALESKVRREDGAAEFFGSIFMELFHELRDTGFNLVHRHQVANHTRAANKHALRRELQGFFREDSHAFSIGITLFARASVSVTAVHDHSRCKVGMFQSGLVIKDRGSLHLIGGKNGEAAGSLFALEKSHIGIAAGLDSGANSRCGKALGGANAAFFQHSVHSIS